MMYYDPEREILNSDFYNNKIGQTYSIVKPKLKIGFRLENGISKLDKAVSDIFTVAVWYDLVLSDAAEYKLYITSTTDIIDHNKPLSVDSLKMVADDEIKEIEKIVSADVISKGIVLHDPIRLKYDHDRLKSDIQTELDRYTLEG